MIPISTLHVSSPKIHCPGVLSLVGGWGYQPGIFRKRIRSMFTRCCCFNFFFIFTLDIGLIVQFDFRLLKWIETKSTNWWSRYLRWFTSKSGVSLSNKNPTKKTDRTQIATSGKSGEKKRCSIVFGFPVVFVCLFGNSWMNCYPMICIPYTMEV